MTPAVRVEVWRGRLQPLWGRRGAHCRIVLPCPIRGPGGLPQLSPPTGPFPVGRIAFHWIDSSRSAEPFVSALATRRELMVYVWYPLPRSTTEPGRARGNK